jgi:hypothetical protein
MLELELEFALRGLQQGRQPSEIRDHTTRCCAHARAWLRCLDASFHRGRALEAPPTWITRRWPSDTTTHPLHWCEIPAARTLGPGASAALARELWSERCAGIDAVELVERGCGALAYHEAVGRVQGDRLEIWMPRDGAWRRSAAADSSHSPLSLRVAGSPSMILRWGAYDVVRGRWMALGSPRHDVRGQTHAPNASSAAPAPTPARSQNA